MATSNTAERMQTLEQIEGNVYQVMNYAHSALIELAKDKPSIKSVEGHVNQFTKCLENVENQVNQQLQYLSKVSTLHPHEGSCYASNKVHQMAIQRVEHVRNCFSDLENLKKQHQLQLQKYNNSKNQKNKTSEFEIKHETN